MQGAGGCTLPPPPPAPRQLRGPVMCQHPGRVTQAGHREEVTLRICPVPTAGTQSSASLRSGGKSSCKELVLLFAGTPELKILSPLPFFPVDPVNPSELDHLAQDREAWRRDCRVDCSSSRLGLSRQVPLCVPGHRQP